MRNAIPELTTSTRASLRRAAAAVVCAAAACAIMAASAGAGTAAASPEHRCKLPGYSSVTFVYGVTGTSPHVLLHVRNARVICGGPDDGHWDPIGSTHTVVLAPAPKIRLIPYNSTASWPATLPQLIQLTRLKGRDRTFGWFGDAYGVTVNSAGQIASLTELFHP